MSKPAEDDYVLWPGSGAACDEGCVCPVLDNGYGDVELARARGGWWQVSDCPVHGEAPAPVPAQPGSQPIGDRKDSR